MTGQLNAITGGFGIGLNPNGEGGDAAFDHNHHGKLQSEILASKAEETKQQDRQNPALKIVEAKFSDDSSRLIIEKDPNSGGFIYKSLDPKTGEVTRIWPQAEVADAIKSISDVDIRGMIINESI